MLLLLSRYCMSLYPLPYWQNLVTQFFSASFADFRKSKSFTNSIMLQDQFRAISSFIERCYLNGSMITKAPFLSVCLVATSALMVISLLDRRKKTKRLSNVFVAGLDDGKRTLAQARKHFVSHCADMLIEGYEKVWFKEEKSSISLLLGSLNY